MCEKLFSVAVSPKLASVYRFSPWQEAILLGYLFNRGVESQLKPRSLRIDRRSSITLAYESSAIDEELLRFFLLFW